MTASIFSLVLASATGWALLALGLLPVSQLKQHGGEPLKAVGAWIVVAATAAPGVFHWYLIFAIVCLVAWTKLDRPAGKIWLAAAAALSLSLGIVFPLEISPELLARENPIALGLLYVGGAATGVAYALSVACGPAPSHAWRPLGFAKGLVIVTMAWVVALVLRCWLAQPAGLSIMATAFALALAMLLLAWFSVLAVRRDRFRQARLFGGIAAILAFADSLMVQLFLP